MRRSFVILMFIIVGIGMVYSLSNSGGNIKSVVIELYFNGPLYQGSFYQGSLPATDYAIWIEDADRNYVETLVVSPSIVSVGQYSHVEHLPSWQKASGVTYEALQKEITEGVAPSFDAVTSANWHPEPTPSFVK